jgi:hypothetical protein
VHDRRVEESRKIDNQRFSRIFEGTRTMKEKKKQELLDEALQAKAAIKEDKAMYT